MSATYVIFLDSDGAFKVGLTASEMPVVLASESDLEMVEGDVTARSLRRLLQAGEARGLHELTVSS